MTASINYGTINDVGVRVGDGTGVMSWKLDISDEGHRTYTAVFRVKTTNSEGPATVANTIGLPNIGDPWLPSRWNLYSEIDIWARNTPYLRATPVIKSGEKSEFWDVELKFSTRPRSGVAGRGCQDLQWLSPVAEPQRISGSFVRKTKEARYDKDGAAIHSSSFELLHGPSVEFDENYPTVTIEQNVYDLELAKIAKLARRTVNGVTMWDLGLRQVRLASASWSRNFVGLCEIYYTRSFTFEIDYNTWDRDDVVDEGSKAYGRWDRSTNPPTWSTAGLGSKLDPRNYDRYKDRTTGEIAHCLLDGDGEPLGTSSDPVTLPTIQYYYDTIDVGNGDESVDYIKMLDLPLHLGPVY